MTVISPDEVDEEVQIGFGDVVFKMAETPDEYPYDYALEIIEIGHTYIHYLDRDALLGLQELINDHIEEYVDA